jgi:pimeloyl-ACP methyl ester carboxylesterase
MADLRDRLDGVLSSATIDARPLAYWRAGPTQAPALVMLHGLGSDHTGLLDLAARLTGRQVIVPDLPGFGHSAPLLERHSLRRYAAALDGLRQHLGLTRFALLGHSLGADIALAYAGTYPPAVSELCLLNPIVGSPSPTVRLGELYCRLAAGLPGPLARALLCSVAAVYLQDQLILTTPDLATRRRILHQDYITARMSDPRAISESVRSIRQSPFDQYVRTLRARTLVLTGARDRLSTPRAVTRLPWKLPYPELMVLPDAGHLLPAEQPDQVVAIVERFLEASSPAHRSAYPSGRTRPRASSGEVNGDEDQSPTTAAARPSPR